MQNQFTEEWENERLVYSKANGIHDSSAKNEIEAENNSRNILGNRGISVNTASSTGVVQRKPKSKVEVENSGTKKKEGNKPEKNENKYSFTAETKVPMPGSRKFGKLSLLDDLDLKITGEKKSEEPISWPVDLETFKIKVAIQLAKLELKKNPVQAKSYGDSTKSIFNGINSAL